MSERRREISQVKIDENLTECTFKPVINSLAKKTGVAGQ
jgi:hypothetical protein